MDPELLKLLASILQPQPTFTSRGVMEPYSQDWQAQRGNLLQDILQLTGIPQDILIPALTGGYDPAQFAAVPTGQPMQLPRRPTFDAYLATQGVEGQIARDIEAGMSPAQIIEDMRAQGAADNDIKEYRTLANDLFRENAQFQQELAEVPRDAQGQPILQQMEDSPAARQFREAGLPTPFDQYGAADFGGLSNDQFEAEALRQQSLAPALQRYQQAQAGVDSAEADIRSANTTARDAFGPRRQGGRAQASPNLSAPNPVVAQLAGHSDPYSTPDGPRQVIGGYEMPAAAAPVDVTAPPVSGVAGVEQVGGANDEMGWLQGIVERVSGQVQAAREVSTVGNARRQSTQAVQRRNTAQSRHRQAGRELQRTRQDSTNAALVARANARNANATSSPLQDAILRRLGGLQGLGI